MKVVLFLRNLPGGFSIENITYNIHKHLPTNTSKIYKTKYPVKGIINKLKSSYEVISRQGDINHITGDAHFLTYFLKQNKTILTIHDCERLMTKDLGFFKKSLYKFLYFTLPNYRCKKVTTISNESKKNLIKYTNIPAEKIQVIYDGVDDSFRKVVIKNKQQLLQNSTSKKTILHIGAPQINKNVKRLLLAIKGLNVKLVKVGKFRNEELNLLRKSHIDFLHFEKVDQDELIKIYNSVDTLVFPSTIEGFGLPIVEAQKCGCPVITSNCSSMPEVGGEGAYYVDPYSIQSITKGIENVISNEELQRNLIKDGFTNAKRFEWKNIAKQYLAIYNEVYERSL